MSNDFVSACCVYAVIVDVSENAIIWISRSVCIDLN